jgi:hypothetical protein
MARKVLNRHELRDANDAAERQSKDAEATGAVKKKKAPAKKKPRTKTAKEVRLKAFWGVFNQSLKRVALFEYSQRPSAAKKAEELTISQKSPHFVQPVKEAITE